jgi:serine phosphatase RsbU (regulator of sigma subunit)
VIAFLCFFFFQDVLLAQMSVVGVSKKDAIISNIGRSVMVFADAEKKLSFGNIVSRPEIFESYPKDNINFGYDAKSAFWLHFKVQAEDTLVKKRILEFPFPLIDTIEFYTRGEKDSVFTKRSSGSVLPFFEREFLHTGHAFLLDFEKNSTYDIYVRMTGNSTMILDCRLMTEEAFRENNRKKDLWYGVFLGLMGIMLLYNSVLAINTRNFSYYLYVISIFFALMTFFSVGGYSYKYLWTNFPELNRVAVKLGMAGIGVFSTSFAYFFLDVNKYLPKFGKLMILHASVGVLIFGLTLVPSLSSFGLVTKGPNTYVSVTALLMLISGIWTYAKGNKVARFFVLSWIMYIFGGLAITLRNAGILPFNDFTTHGAEAGVMFEVFLLSLALGDRYRILRKEKEDAVNRIIEVQKQANEELEQKVRERTQQYLEANEELKQTVEELDATNESLNELNVSLSEQKGIIEKKNHDITASINYAARIQGAILPKVSLIEKSFGEAFVFFRPRDIVSGDFYWFAEKDGTALLAVADCTGHGVPGSLMSMIGAQILNSLVFEKNLLSPEHVLGELSEQIRVTLRQEETNTNDGMDIALVALRKEHEQAVLAFAGAMSSLYIMREDDLHEYRGDKKAIGGKKFGENAFTKQEFFLKKDEKLRFYLATDGFYDQFGGDKNKKYLSKRFREFTKSLKEIPVAEQRECFEKEFDEWKGKNPQLDDVTVLGAEITGR